METVNDKNAVGHWYLARPAFGCLALIVLFPIAASSNEESEYRWYLDSGQRWCLQHDEKDLCLPKTIQPKEFRSASATFELAGSGPLPLMTVGTVTSIDDPYRESNLDDLPYEVVERGKVNGIDKIVPHHEALDVIKLQLSADLILLISGLDTDRMDKWVWNLTAQWNVNTRTYSHEGPCAKVFMLSCVTDSPVATKLIQEIDSL